MNKDDFNDNATMPLLSASHSYIIEPAYPENCDGFTRMTTVGKLKNDIEKWVLETTGCLPSATICAADQNEELVKESINIHCTRDFIIKLEAAFHDRIAKVTRIPTRDEIVAQEGPDLCWRPVRG